MNNYDFYFDNNILFIEFKDITENIIVNDIIESIKLSFPNKQFDIVAKRNILGYWTADDYLNNKSIYCGTMSLKITKEQIKKYLND
jgi:hypothetical protein